VILSENITMHP